MLGFAAFMLKTQINLCVVRVVVRVWKLIVNHLKSLDAYMMNKMGPRMSISAHESLNYSALREIRRPPLGRYNLNHSI